VLLDSSANAVPASFPASACAAFSCGTRRYVGKEWSEHRSEDHSCDDLQAQGQLDVVDTAHHDQGVISKRMPTSKTVVELPASMTTAKPLIARAKMIMDERMRKRFILDPKTDS